MKERESKSTYSICCGKRGTIRRAGIRWLMLMLSVLLVAPMAPDAWSAPTAQSSKSKKSKGKSGSTTSTRKKGTGSAKKSSGSKSRSRSNGSKGSKSGGSGAPKTSAEAKRRQQQAQQEVARAQEELRLNEASIKKNLSALGKIDDDISASDKEVKTLRGNIGRLQTKISGLEGQIAENNAKLERMRTEYLKAVKKMRGSRKRNSELAFIFSSKSLGEAERRMRYMKQFSEWKDKQTAQINATVTELSGQKEALARTRSDCNVMLGREEKAAKKLREQRAEQDRIVTDLKANGRALQAHLQKKQAEVNSLRNAVASLIAAEQAKAETERRRREAAEAEARRREAEEAARAAEAAEAAASAPELEKETSKSGDTDVKKRRESSKKASEESKRSKERNLAKNDRSSKSDKSDKSSKSAKSDGKDYASARKRAPRGGDARKGKSAATATPKTPKGSSAGDFAAMKGSLPRPVSGAFRITSHFGRHALPELPDVMYDNPGIDAETSPGAAVKAVYPGRVSGVYMIPGFSTVVIVNHGDYYTVYGNIASASVKVGTTVKTGDGLGSLAPDPDDPSHSVLHFEVWKNREKLNPESWIR